MDGISYLDLSLENRLDNKIKNHKFLVHTLNIQFWIQLHIRKTQ